MQSNSICSCQPSGKCYYKLKIFIVHIIITVTVTEFHIKEIIFSTRACVLATISQHDFFSLPNFYFGNVTEIIVIEIFHTSSIMHNGTHQCYTSMSHSQIWKRQISYTIWPNCGHLTIIPINVHSTTMDIILCYLSLERLSTSFSEHGCGDLCTFTRKSISEIRDWCQVRKSSLQSVL